MKTERINPLSVDFLYELFATSMRYEAVCNVLVQHVKSEYMPDKSFQKLLLGIGNYYRNYQSPPSYAVLSQQFNGDYDAIELIDTFRECDGEKNQEVILDMLESYIKGVRLQAVYSEVGKLYNQSKQGKAEEKLREYADWLSGFTLKSSAFVDVGKTFGERFQKNKQKDLESQHSTLVPVSRFYVHELDVLNGGRSLRGQLTCFLASTGVGKSHIAKHVGIRACIDSGLHVIHLQLEGSEAEALDAYSGGLISKNSFYFERGRITDEEMAEFQRQIENYKGSITVRTFPRFNSRVSTLDVKNAIAEYRKLNNHPPDIVIVDSMDLLTDASRRQWDAEHERSKRIAVANDLKDLAADENVWMVVTYQATIENREWLNDENNVLTEYNCSEAKGLSRPCTHLISLNQSAAERKEDTMRLHIAKSRFFKKGETLKIATDYDNEIFYDARRTMNLKR